jgi:hypothetical protein
MGVLADITNAVYVEAGWPVVGGGKAVLDAEDCGAGFTPVPVNAYWRSTRPEDNIA